MQLNHGQFSPKVHTLDSAEFTCEGKMCLVSVYLFEFKFYVSGLSDAIDHLNQGWF